MPKRLILSIDAMGGDDAPDMVLQGVDRVRRRSSSPVEFLLFGDEKRIRPLLDTLPEETRRACQIHHTDEAITMEDKPSTALRGGANTSMRLAINAVFEGKAAGVVSAGNTGALMAMAKFVFRMLPGIQRPAIAALLPTQRGTSVVLDLGANVECDGDNLVQFAVMGEVFARNVLEIEQPSIGILNIGTELLKGNDSVRNASAMLQESNLPIKFHGFIEGDDICAGTVDVVVTDGFTGNVALKTAEGTAKLFSHLLKESLMGSWLSKIGALFARSALYKLRHKFDARRYNGAMMVGLNGICVKSHGNTDALGFEHAINVAIHLIEGDFNERIKEDLERLIADQPDEKVAAGS